MSNRRWWGRIGLLGLAVLIIVVGVVIEKRRKPRAFVDQKIYHVQINVVSSDTLRAAQKEPDNYRDLVVKVAGYNTFFVQLSKPLQDGIIAKTEHRL